MSDPDPSAGGEPILLKNRIAVLTPEPIAEGAFGKVYVGKILNPVGLIAERIVWGEESPRWLGLEDIPYEEPDRSLSEERLLPVPLTDPVHRRKVHEAAGRLWTEYLERRKQDRAKADEEYRDLLRLIDPLLHEDRVIAVKVLRPPQGQDPDDEPRLVADSVRRFIKENDILRSLRHPNIVRRFGLVRDAGMGWCLLLEYIEGETLDDHAARYEKRRMPLPEAARLVREVVAGIEYIHAQGVVHRDLKPQNIMVCADGGRAVIMDFGIGKWADESHTQQISQAGMRVGTPKYMAPEQATIGGTVSRAADVYQLATIFFELVTGRAAYAEMDQPEVFQWLLDPARGHPVTVQELLPSISKELEALIEVGREKDPARRWTIEEFRDRLDRVIADGKYEGPSPYHAAGKARLTQALKKTRIRIKEAQWEERLIETRLRYAELKARVQQAWDLLARRTYEKARSAVEALGKEVAALPLRYKDLQGDVGRLERAFLMATSRYEAEYLIGMAEQHCKAGRYPDAGGALDSAAQRLMALPVEAFEDVHKRFRALNDLYDTQHRAFVDLFVALRKSFIEKIQERYREVQSLYGSGQAVDAARVSDLLQQAATARRQLVNIDREKVGPSTYDGAKKDLEELEIALADLLKRAVTPA